MSSSYTLAESVSFTVTHARHLAAKVATDLKRMQRFYGAPTDIRIAQFELEVTEFLKSGYLGTITYGFRRDGSWIEPTLRYTARDLAVTSWTDDDPGRIRPGADVTGGAFYSYLTYSPSWDRLSSDDKERFRRLLPFDRSAAPEPGISGYLLSDRTYSAGGRALDRATVRSFS